MKKTFISKEKIDEIIKEYPTPFHIYDEKGIRNNIRNLYKAFSWNKGFKEYFAVKATPTPGILKIMKEEGCGLDCSSMSELILSERIGVTGENIMFSSNATPYEEFIKANELGAIINLDDFSHIEYLEKYSQIPKTICCRYNPGEFNIHNQIMDNPVDAKYGFTKEQLKEGFLILKEKGVERFGIHSFLASNTLGDEYYPALAKLLFETSVWIKEETSISFINLSGGIGIPYRPEEKENNISLIGERVKESYYKILKPENLDNISIFTELGRYITGPNGHLITTAIHKKETYKDYIGLDSTAANLMRPAMYGAYHHITVAGKEDDPLTNVYDITGSLCENNDKFAIDRNLPKIEIGDILIIHDTGAHGHSMGYNYNGKFRSAELLLKENGNVKLIRRAETLEDYFRTIEDFI